MEDLEYLISQAEKNIKQLEGDGLSTFEFEEELQKLKKLLDDKE